MPDLSFLAYLPPLPSHVKAFALLLVYAYLHEAITGFWQGNGG